MSSTKKQKVFKEYIIKPYLCHFSYNKLCEGDYPIDFFTAFIVRAIQTIADCEGCYMEFFEIALKHYKKDKQAILVLRYSPKYDVSPAQILKTLKEFKVFIKNKLNLNVTFPQIIDALMVVYFAFNPGLHLIHEQYTERKRYGIHLMTSASD